MKVEFDDPKLRRMAEDERKLVRRFGSGCAKRVRQRLVHLRAVDNVLDLKELPGKWHALEADRSEQWSADLEQPLRLIIRATPPVPRTATGGVDWALVERVTVVEIVDYH